MEGSMADNNDDEVLKPAGEIEEIDDNGLDPEDVSPDDRFFLNGHPLAFDLFVGESMRPIAPRDLIEPQTQSSPAPKDVIWASRRPLG